MCANSIAGSALAMNRGILVAAAVASLALGGCSSLGLDRQQTFVGGGALAGAVAGSAFVAGAPGMTTAVVAGALAGGAAGYVVERFTRPAPPGSAPAAR
jgi:hypothetical protein